MSDPIPFSTALRERASAAHSTSEHAGFMADLITGDGTRDDYIALVAQHWFIYDALESAADRMRRDPVASVFLSDKLTRLPAHRGAAPGGHPSVAAHGVAAYIAAGRQSSCVVLNTHHCMFLFSK